MAGLRQVMNEAARAGIVLALFVFLLGTPAALAATPPSLVQQASALLAGQSLCGHGQVPVACHAPGACCRPDQALPPLRAIEITPARCWLHDDRLPSLSRGAFDCRRNPGIPLARAAGLISIH